VTVSRSRTTLAIEGLREVWGSLSALGATLDEVQFDLPTECPGWSVKDQFSHLIGTELLLEGAAVPDVEVLERDHLHNELGEANERFVLARRGRSGSEVVAEFTELTTHRLETLRALDDEAWQVLGPSPIGMVPYVDFMGVRTFDSWVHEQDVRRAVGEPGGRGGLGERVTLDRMEASMPFVLGRRVGAPEGTTFRIEIEGALGRIMQLVVTRADDGRPRAAATAVIDGEPTAWLCVDEETFVRRCCGRISADLLRDAPGTALGGDVALASSFVDQMVVML
jgi:uncharacterized protein (TIGR03083 family)